MKSEKLLHLFWEFPPYIEGGLGVAGENLCRALSSKVQVDIAHPQFCQTLVLDSSAKYHVFQIRSPEFTNSPPTSSYASELYAEKLYSQIYDFRKGVVNAHFTGYKSIHAHDWITATAAFSLQTSNKKQCTPVFLHIHSTQLERVGIQARGSIFKRELSAMKKADKIIAVSYKTKQVIIDHYSIDPRKISVIHNAAPLMPYALPLKKNTSPTLLFVGRLESQKSPFFAVEVICKVLKSMPRARAIIAGSGTMLESVRELIKFKRMNHRVEVLGKIPQQKMHLIYQSSDILLLPSVDEPFGLVGLEAARSGLAVIMSDRCGVAEVLKSSPQISLNGKDSFNTWVNTAIELLTNHQTRQSLIEDQATDLFDCRWDKAAQQLLQIINS